MTRPGQDCSWIQRNAFGCTSRFDFSLRFEQLILSILPSTIFLVAAFWRIFALSKASRKTQSTHFRTFKLTTAILYAASQIVLLILWSSDLRHTGSSIAASVLSLILALGVLGLAVLEHDRSVRPSTIIMAYLLLSTLFDAAQLRTLALLGTETAKLSVLLVAMLLKVVLLALESKSKARLLERPYRHLPPESLSGMLSRALFWWTVPLFHVGFQRLLSPVDIYPVDSSMQSDELEKRLSRILATSDMSKRHAFLRACLSCFTRDIALMVPSRLILVGFTYSQTFLLERAIELLSETSSVETKDSSYALIGATFLIYLGIAVSTAVYERRVGRLMVKMRGAIVASVFSRALLIADGLDTEHAAITLMSTDVDTITRVFSELNESWARLIEVIIGIALLSRQVGAISLVPIVLAVLSTQAQTWVSKRIGNRRKLWNEATQKRVGTTASVLGSIQAVRISGLMGNAIEHIQTLRTAELGAASSFLKFVVALNAIAVVPSTWAPVLTWIIYAVKAKIGHEGEIDTAQAFTSLALLYLITTPTSRLLTIMPRWAQASACFERLQRYMTLETFTDCRQISTQPEASIASPERTHKGDIALSTWPINPNGSVISIHIVRISLRKSQKPMIDDASLEVPKGSLVVIFGPPGSGKTTLLKALLGEVSCNAGHIELETKSIAYCSQTPWITDTTIANYIKGPGEIQDEVWYEWVIQACDLAKDLHNRPYGDDTRVGSRGAALSGGQKARLALARALYARKEILLLDDVLSAVDARTEAKIVSGLGSVDSPFRQAHRTVIAVSRSSKLIDAADQVVCLSRSRLMAVDRSLGNRLASVDNVTKSTQSQTEEMQLPKQSHRILANPPSLEAKQDLTRQNGEWSTYRYYFRTVSRWSLLLFVACAVAIAFCSSFTQVWLQWWTEAGSSNLALYLTVFAALACLSILFASANMVVVFINVMPASAAKLHYVLLDTVAKSPYSLFYKDNDTGTMLNRFSQDMSLICNQLPTSLISTGNTLCETLASLALISIGASYMGLAIPLVLAAIFVVQKIYLKTSRQLRYLDLERRSPLYSHFLETLEGVVAIRCFGWSEHTKNVNCRLLDDSQAPLYLMYCIQRWLRLVLDLTTMALAVVVVALAVSMRQTTSAGRLGLALTNILSFSQSLSRLITEWTTMETSIGSVARVRSFALNIDATDPRNESLDDITSARSAWPCKGSIIFRRVYAKYNTTDVSDNQCLRDISLEIQPGQKVSVCGRTGSGKTSLMLALFQILPLSSGQIFIDGIDVSSLPQGHLQRSLIGVPQQAFIMPASVRYNLDPSGTVADEKLLGLLSKVRLRDLFEERGGLDATLDQSSLSQGQQQLFCLARALCRKVNGGGIIVLDEPTSNLDERTHLLVSKLIASEFGDCTVIAIAHRVDSILSADVVVFMDDGCLAGFGPPDCLLRDNASFRALCQQ